MGRKPESSMQADLHDVVGSGKDWSFQLTPVWLNNSRQKVLEEGVTQVHRFFGRPNEGNPFPNIGSKIRRDWIRYEKGSFPHPPVFEGTMGNLGPCTLALGYAHYSQSTNFAGKPLFVVEPTVAIDGSRPVEDGEFLIRRFFLHPVE